MAMGGRGRRVAIALAVPGIACLLAAGWFFRRPIVEEWHLLRLRSSDPRVRDSAAEELAAMRSRRAIPRLLGALEQTPGFLLPLLRIGPPAVAALLDSMEEVEANQERRRKVLGLLLDLGPQEKQELAPSIAGAIGECEKEESRVLALKLVVQLRLQGEAVQTALEAGLRNLSPEVRGTAALAAASIDPGQAAGMIPALTDLLRDSDEVVRSRAVSGLGRMGAGAATALPALTRALADESEYVRSMAALAVARVGTGGSAGAAVSALVDFLRDRDWEGGDCPAAVQALGELGPAAREAEPLLLEMSRKAEDPLREHAAKALRRIRGEPEPGE